MILIITKHIYQRIIKTGEKIMAAIDNLNTAVSNQSIEIDKVIGVISDLKKQIADLQAAATASNNDTAIQAASDTINSDVSKLDAAIQ